jgi:oligopeptide transport system permease protein
MDDLFRPVNKKNQAGPSSYRHISYWGDVFKRLVQNKSTVVCLILLFLIFLGTQIIPRVNASSIEGVILDKINEPPSFEHWMGCDRFGHDVFTKMWKGGQISFFVGLVAAFSQSLIGVTIGCIASYCGGKVDMVIMRIIDVLISIPYLIVVLVIRVVMGSGTWTIIFALIVTGWLSVARLTRGQILQLKGEDYILAAQSLGVKPVTIMFRHLIPNVMGVVIVSLTLSIPAAMFSEAFLSFIGMGTNAVSWGSLIRTGMEVRFLRPLQLIGPSVLLGLTMLCIQLIGDALRDSLDPKLRK